MRYGGKSLTEILSFAFIISLSSKPSQGNDLEERKSMMYDKEIKLSTAVGSSYYIKNYAKPFPFITEIDEKVGSSMK